DRALADTLRQTRKDRQAELRDLKQDLKDARKAEEKHNKRAAAEREWEGYPPGRQLCTAIQYNRADLVQRVVESGALVIQQDLPDCYFPLGDAAARGHLDIVEYLLSKGAPTLANAPLGQRISAMDAAASSQEDRTAILSALHRAGVGLADANQASLPGALVEQGDDFNKEQLKRQQNIEAADLGTGTSLTRALEEGHIANIRWLLANGAHPEESMLGRTALMIAVDSNDPEKVKALLDAGADVNRQGPGFRTALMHATSRLARVGKGKKADMEAIVALLKARGAQ
ncbi:MAG: ankyrin repeat domain-containing protein, partial [Gammaproteobacteria bacterium]|nr:ankyrin repeat domain-containing protein [Gammaproteobacteria bacterium]